MSGFPSIYDTSGIRMGFADYSDAATSTTPISVPQGVPTVLTNDAAGPFTNTSHLPAGVTRVWNGATNQFDWSELSIGDTVDIRLDGTVVTTTPNQTFLITLVAGIGSGSEYSIPFAGAVTKSVGSVPASRFNGIYIGNSETKDFPAELRITSDAAATVVVNGWYCRIIKAGV